MTVCAHMCLCLCICGGTLFVRIKVLYLIVCLLDIKVATSRFSIVIWVVS